MPKYKVNLEDGRAVNVYASNKEEARSQAIHHETTRVIIADRRRVPSPPVSIPTDMIVIKART